VKATAFVLDATSLSKDVFSIQSSLIGLYSQTSLELPPKRPVAMYPLLSITNETASFAS